ncbi:MAG: Na/Pi cotransporter family protein [Flavobacteriales bacterium]|nr:Na/Pi cotransporter family protein [Flavobacteriales bacterium]
MNYSLMDLLSLIGALGFFIYGMKVMSDGIQKVAGNRMRRILSAMTSNRVFGVFTGFIITSLVQSSSATTVMVVSFVNAGLLSLIESIGVIMGANIGTTLTAWLISIFGFKVKISAMALPIIAFGFPMLFSSRGSIKSWGEVLIGFALLFMGLEFLKDSVPDLQSNPQVLEFLSQYTDKGLLSTLIFIGVGTVITIVVQSSSAAMALTLVMCYQGWIPFQLAAAMILGENIGTTITANLAALVANVHAKRAARAHFLFNTFGVVWMIIAFPLFISGINNYMANNPTISGTGGRQYSFEQPPSQELFDTQLQQSLGDAGEFIEWTWVTPKKLNMHYSLFKAAGQGIDIDSLAAIRISEELVALGITAAQYHVVNIGARPSEEASAIPIALSIFHTTFNILNVLMLVWFVPFIARTVTRFLPAKGVDDEVFHLSFIGSGMMGTAELSIIEARKEISKFGEIIVKLYDAVPQLLHATEEKKFQKLMKRVAKYEDMTDRMELEIAKYLSKASESELSNDASRRVRSMLSIISDLETIGDLCYQIAQNLERRRAIKAYFTPELRQKSELMFIAVEKSISNMTQNLNRDYEKVTLTEAKDIEEEINDLRNKLRNEHLENIEKGLYPIHSGMYYNDLIHSLEKIGDHAFDVSEAIVLES